MMGDYGRVFRMKVEAANRSMTSEGTFMVIAPSSEPIVRAKMKTYRQTICIEGRGFWAGGLVGPGEMIPTKIDDPRIEWLD